MPAGSGDEFERALRKDLPRGLPDGEDALPRSVWADPKGLGPEWDYQEGQGLLLGYRTGRSIGWNDDRHAITIAGTRAGKGVSLIIPNLLSFKGSVLAIDPKGELARITRDRRAELGKKGDQPGKVVILDPFAENGVHPTGHYNPLSELDATSREVIDEAGSIAQGLVIYQGHGDPHWTSAARGVLRALILMVLDFKPEDRNLITVRQLLMLTHPWLVENANARLKQGMKGKEGKPETRSEALSEMMIGQGDNFEGVVAGQGEALKDMSDKERESVLSEARTQTMFLDSPALRDILRKSDFSLKELSRDVVSVFLCLPARHMDTHDRWLRVIINLAVGALEPRRGPHKRSDQGTTPVLLLLEEFPVLKHMEKIQAAAGQLAGSGVKLWVIIQNLGQLKQHYEKAWETFIANAGVLTAFGNADVETLKYLGEKMGKVAMNIVTASGASVTQRLAGARRDKEELRDAALLETDEASQHLAREKMRVLVLAAGRPPLLLERMLYFKEDRFKGMFRE